MRNFDLVVDTFRRDLFSLEGQEGFALLLIGSLEGKKGPLTGSAVMGMISIETVVNGGDVALRETIELMEAQRKQTTSPTEVVQ